MATMKDVAKLAGVSLGTVSRVVNHVPGVKAATLKKVNAAISALDYQPDEYARGLKTNSSNTLALIVPSIWNPFFAEFAYHIEQAAIKHGYKILLCNSNSDDGTEKDYINMVKQNKIDGIIAISYRDIDQYVDSRLPFISVDRSYEENVSYVTSDNYNGGRLAAQKLLELGVTNFGFVGSYNKHANTTMMRFTGFQEELERHGITPHNLYEREPVQHQLDHIHDFLVKNRGLDGIFCQTDVLAIDVMRELGKLGRSVPGDVQVIGFDGIKILNQGNYIVSTIAQPIQAIAENCLKLLFEKIKNPLTPTTVVKLPVRYQFGETTLK